MEDSEGTVRQIGAFSEGIQNLTVRLRGWDLILLHGYFWKYIFFCAVHQSMLKDDELFKEASNSPNPSVTDDDSAA